MCAPRVRVLRIHGRFRARSQDGKIATSKRENLVVSGYEVGCSEDDPNSRRDAVCLDSRFEGRLGPAMNGARIVDGLFPDLAVSDLSRGPRIYR